MHINNLNKNATHSITQGREKVLFASCVSFFLLACRKSCRFEQNRIERFDGSWLQNKSGKVQRVIEI